MKKLCTFISICLLLIPYCNIFAEESDNQANVTIEVIGNNQMNTATEVDESQVAKVYAVNINWQDNFEFIYTFNQNNVTYNADSMKYMQSGEDPGWNVTYKLFSVENRSNEDVVVTPTLEVKNNKNLNGETQLKIQSANSEGIISEDDLTGTAVEIMKASSNIVNTPGEANSKYFAVSISGKPNYANNDTDIHSIIHLSIVSKTDAEQIEEIPEEETINVTVWLFKDDNKSKYADKLEFNISANMTWQEFYNTNETVQSFLIPGTPQLKSIRGYLFKNGTSAVYWTDTVLETSYLELNCLGF